MTKEEIHCMIQDLQARLAAARHQLAQLETAANLLQYLLEQVEEPE